MPRLELAGDRFWEVTRTGTTLTIVSGKLGSAGRTTTKTAADEEAAEALLEHLIDEMHTRGYQATEPGTSKPAAPAQPARKTEPRNPELEAAILKDPEDAAAYSVYADWLQGQNELRGELIAAQIAADARDSAKARAAAAELLETHASYFSGALAHDATLTLSWQRGFIHSAELEARPGESARTLEQLLVHPSARFLVGLALELEADDPKPALDVLARHLPKSLRALELFARCELPDLEPLWRACQELRRLELAAHSFAGGGMELPQLERARFLCTALGGRAARAIAAAPWPALEHLDIYFGEGSTTYGDVSPLLERTDLPKLTHLKLRGASFVGRICRALPASPFANQLIVLDLSKGDLADADDLVALAAHRFERLKEIVLPVTLAQGRRFAPAVERLAKSVVGAERRGEDHTIMQLLYGDEDEEYYDEIHE
jgi:uncharacterized protein (TIGR02996 family)